jgi:hypothetical protein
VTLDELEKRNGPFVLDSDLMATGILSEAGHLFDIMQVSPKNCDTVSIRFPWRGYHVMASRSYGFKDHSDNGFLLVGLPKSFGEEEANAFFDSCIAGLAKGRVCVSPLPSSMASSN